METNKKSRIFRGYKLKIETLVILKKLHEIENRSLTNVIENLILDKGLQLKLSCTDQDVDDFLEEIVKSKK